MNMLEELLIIILAKFGLPILFGGAVALYLTLTDRKDGKPQDEPPKEDPVMEQPQQCVGRIEYRDTKSQCPNRVEVPLRVPDAGDGRMSVKLGICRACQAAIKKEFQKDILQTLTAIAEGQYVEGEERGMAKAAVDSERKAA